MINIVGVVIYLEIFRRSYMSAQHVVLHLLLLILTPVKFHILHYNIDKGQYIRDCNLPRNIEKILHVDDALVS